MRRCCIVAGFVLLFGRSIAFGAELSTCESARDDRRLATISYRRGDLAATITALRRATMLCPAEPFYQFMLGNALYRAGEITASANAYEAFLHLRPNHFEGHMCLGFVKFELADQKEAVEQWTTAVRLEPQSPFAHAALAVGLYSVQDLDNARIQYQVATALDARYAVPEALAIDIRWKLSIRAKLNAVKHLVDSELKGER